MTQLTPYLDHLRSILTAGLSPSVLHIADESHQHHSHFSSGYTDGTHLNLTIVSEAFNGLSLVARHRLVNTLLAGELKDRIHALKLALHTPHDYTGGQ